MSVLAAYGRALVPSGRPCSIPGNAIAWRGLERPRLPGGSASGRPQAVSSGTAAAARLWLYRLRRDQQPRVTIPKVIFGRVGFS